MMYVPAIFGESLMDDWMDDFDKGFRAFDKEFDREFNRGFGSKNPLFGKHSKNLMKTDVRENEDSYSMNIDIPGFKKEDINLSLEDGFLTITAAKGLDKESSDKESGRIIRRERYSGTLSRSFFVGEDITEDEIKAKLEHGVLKLTVPKKDPAAQIPHRKTIMIEG